MDHLRVFHDVARSLTAQLDLEAILGNIMSKMANFFDPERWSLMLVDDKKDELFYAIAIGQNRDSLKGLRVRMGEGVAGWVAATGNPLVVPDVSLDNRWKAFTQAHPELNIHSIACLPISSGGKTLGVIQLLNSKLDLLSEYSISFLRILCDYAAIAITNNKSVTLIQELTITDDCTGLFNARHLYTMLEEQAHRDGRFSLLFIDLDRFKQVNDTHGHLIGSRLLAEAGDLMRRSMGPGTSSFRYGGDEFVILLPAVGKDVATGKTVTLRNDLRATRFLEGAGLSLQLSGSFGLACFPEDGDTVQTILRAADTMMYEAKVDRDTVVVAGHGVVAGRRVDRTMPALTAGETLARKGTAASVEDTAPLQ